MNFNPEVLIQAKRIFSLYIRQIRFLLSGKSHVCNGRSDSIPRILTLFKGFTEHALEKHNKAKCFFTAKNISEQFRQDRVIKPEDPGYFEFENYDFESNIFTQDIHDHHDQHYDDNEETGDEKPKVCLL